MQIYIFDYTFLFISKKPNNLASPTHHSVHCLLCSHQVARVIILTCHHAGIQHSRPLINTVSQTQLHVSTLYLPTPSNTVVIIGSYIVLYILFCLLFDVI